MTTIEDRVRLALLDAEDHLRRSHWAKITLELLDDGAGDVVLNIGPLWPDGERERAVLTIRYEPNDVKVRYVHL